MKRRTVLLRDTAIVAAAACALALHLLGERWGIAALSAIAAAFWIVAARRFPRLAEWAGTTGFLLIGALLVWRFHEARLWISVSGMWCLVAAADLSRLSVHFPVDSPLQDQRLLLQRRLRHLAALAVSSGAVVVLGRVLAIQIRLPAVALLAVFVVMVVVRTVRSIAGERLAGEDQEVSG